MNELSKKGKLTLKSFTELPVDERIKLLKLMAQYQNKIYKGEFNKSLSRSLGPMDSGKCGCCGK